jgi:hypothetical protein
MFGANMRSKSVSKFNCRAPDQAPPLACFAFAPMHQRSLAGARQFQINANPSHIQNNVRATIEIAKKLLQWMQIKHPKLSATPTIAFECAAGHAYQTQLTALSETAWTVWE